MGENEGVFQFLPCLLTGNDLGKEADQVIAAEVAHNGIVIQSHGKGGGHNGLHIFHGRPLNARNADQRQHAPVFFRGRQHFFQRVVKGHFVEHGDVVAGGRQLLSHIPGPASLHVPHKDEAVDIVRNWITRHADGMGNPGNGALVVNAAILHDNPALPAHKGVQQMLPGKARIVGGGIALVVEMRLLRMHCIRIVHRLNKGVAGLIAFPAIIDHVPGQVDTLIRKKRGAQHFLHQALLQQGAADAARCVGNEGSDYLVTSAAVVADLAVGNGHPAVDVRGRETYGENAPVFFLPL